MRVKPSAAYWILRVGLALALFPSQGMAQSVVPRVSLRFDQVELAEVVEQLAETWHEVVNLMQVSVDPKH